MIRWFVGSFAIETSKAIADERNGPMEAAFTNDSNAWGCRAMWDKLERLRLDRIEYRFSTLSLVLKSTDVHPSGAAKPLIKVSIFHPEKFSIYVNWWWRVSTAQRIASVWSLSKHAMQIETMSLSLTVAGKFDLEAIKTSLSIDPVPLLQCGICCIVWVAVGTVRIISTRIEITCLVVEPKSFTIHSAISFVLLPRFIR